MKIVERIVGRGIDRKLALAVVRQLGGGKDALESLRDISAHGIDGGFHGFIYTVDTVKFFKRNRAEILALVERMALDLGEDPISMVAGFNCLAGRNGKKSDFTPSVARCLYGSMAKPDDDSVVANALAWFAGEEVARAFVDSEEGSKSHA